jgi:TonB family protein
LAFSFAAVGLFAQNERETIAPITAEPGEPEVYTLVEEEPVFPGGILEMYKFVSHNIHYPAAAREAGLSGKCFIKFVVSSEGKIKDAVILKGVSGCPDCDAEALRVVKMMPDWKPGRQSGKPVNVYYNLPVSFKIETQFPKETLTVEQQKAADFFDIGMKEQANGKYEKALSQFDSCLKYRPEHLDGLYNKAVMHFKLNQKKPACETWNKLIALNRNDKEVEGLIKKHCN